MRKIFFLGLSSLLLRCTAPSQPENATPPAQPHPGFLSQSTRPSSFTILKHDSLAGYTYRSIDVQHKVVYIAPKGEFDHYWATFTTVTNSCTGCEGQEDSVWVVVYPFDHPDQTVCTIRHDCDEVLLEPDYYKTVKHGCCGAEDQLALYDYNNQQIIAGEGKIVLGGVPNSKVKLWVAYQSSGQDTTFQGTIFVSYNGAERYAIRIASPQLPAEFCNPYSPDIAIRSSDPRDKVVEGNNNEYELWSFDGLDQAGKLKHLTLRFTFDCEGAPRPAPVEIPIIDGKPFGKAEKNQTVALKFLSK